MAIYMANKLDENLFLGIILTGGNISTQGGSQRNPEALFFSLFLGKADEVVSILNTTFPELGLTEKDCTETSWIESSVMAANGFQHEGSLEALLNRTPLTIGSSKMKSDYVKKPITKATIESMWERFKSQDTEGYLAFVPYGGKMSQISESEIPFPHRADWLLHGMGRAKCGGREKTLKLDTRALHLHDSFRFEVAKSCICQL